MKEASDILSAMKKATIFDIFLISFFALPFIFNTWVDVFTKVGLPQKGINRSLVALFIMYIIFLFIMYVGGRSEKQKALAKDQIMAYLQAKGFVMISYQRVRLKINQSYTDQFLEQVIDHYPKDFRRAKLKGERAGIRSPGC